LVARMLDRRLRPQWRRRPAGRLFLAGTRLLLRCSAALDPDQSPASTVAPRPSFGIRTTLPVNCAKKPRGVGGSL